MTDTVVIEVVTATTAVETVEIALQGPPGPPGASDHGALVGLSDDDHPLYHTDARGDARYVLGGNGITSITGPIAVVDYDVPSVNVVYSPLQGESELDGDSEYSSGSVVTLGFLVATTAAISFDAFEAKIASTSSMDITLTIHVRESTASFPITNTTTLVYKHLIKAADFPRHLTISRFSLGYSVSASANQYIYILFTSPSGGVLKSARFLSGSGRLGFPYASTTGSVNLSSGSAGWQAGTRLFQTALLSKTPVIVYQHPRGDSELVGNSSYKNNCLGLYELIETPIVFDRFTAKFWCGVIDRDIRISLFVRASAAAFNPSTEVAVYDKTLSAKNVPHTAFSPVTIQLGASIYVAAGKYLFIVLCDAQTPSELNVARFTEDSSSAPFRSGLFFSSSYSSVFSVGSSTYKKPSFTLIGYTQTPISLSAALNGLSDLIATAAPSEGSGGTAATTTYDPSASGLVATTVQSVIDELALGEMPTLSLPDEIPVVVGYKTQLYFRSIICAYNPYSLPIDVSCSIGNTFPRYFEVTPAAGNVGTKTLTLSIKNVRNRLRVSQQVDLIVVNPTGQPVSQVNVLCVGDSLLSQGAWPVETRRMLTSTGGSPAGLGYGNITFLGNTSLCGVGQAGWSFSNYIGNGALGYVVTCLHDKDLTDQKSKWIDANSNTWEIEFPEPGAIKMIPYAHSSAIPAAPSTLTWSSGGTHHATISYTAAVQEPSTPFWDSATGQFSFAAYCADKGYSGIDILYVNLGWNTINIVESDDPSLHLDDLDNAITFISKFHAEYPSGKMRILGIAPPSMSGGLGTNYGASNAWSRYLNACKSVAGLNKAYQDLCNDSAYQSYCRFVATGVVFDTENNYPSAAAAVNTRNPLTELRGTNGIHPNEYGYLQISDAVFNDFIRTYCS